MSPRQGVIRGSLCAREFLKPAGPEDLAGLLQEIQDHRLADAPRQGQRGDGFRASVFVQASRARPDFKVPGVCRVQGGRSSGPEAEKRD